MTVEVIHFPSGIYPEQQILVPDRGPGQTLGQSPFIGAQTVTTMRGAERWRLEMSWSGLTGADRAELTAMVTRLRISHNTFLCVQHTNPKRGDAYLTTWTPINNSFQVLGIASGGVQNLRIWFAGNAVSPTSSTPLKAGDYFSVNSELKMQLVDMPPLNSSGVGSAYFWPPLFTTVSCGTKVFVNSPCGGFRMENVSVFNTRPPGYITDLSIRAVERINSAMVSDFA